MILPGEFSAVFFPRGERFCYITMKQNLRDFAIPPTLEIPLKPPILQPPRGCKIFLLVVAKFSSSWLQNLSPHGCKMTLLHPPPEAHPIARVKNIEILFQNSFKKIYEKNNEFILFVFVLLLYLCRI